MTVTICIGNSDDKLRQGEWSRYVADVTTAIRSYCCPIHFTGFSNPESVYQNACWVGTVEIDDLERLEKVLTCIRKNYQQDSVAIITGETRFV